MWERFVIPIPIAVERKEQLLVEPMDIAIVLTVIFVSLIAIAAIRTLCKWLNEGG